MRRRHAAAAALVWCAPAWSAQRAPRAAAALRSKAYGRRGDVLAAARSIAVEHALDTDWVEATLAQARFVPDVAQLIMPATTPAARNWDAYRARFVETRRIEAGARWWRDNDSWLDLAEQRFGVPADIVVGIVGVETYYGRVSGSFRVLDALATLSFDFPSGRSDRSGFFRSELGHFLKLAQPRGLGCRRRAGFVRRRDGAAAVHAEQRDQLCDRFRRGRPHRPRHQQRRRDRQRGALSCTRTAGSAACRRTMRSSRRPTSSERALLLVPDIVPSFNPAQMVDAARAWTQRRCSTSGSLALIELHNAEAAPSYVAGTQNFYALTRYNASSYYALAVIELGRAVASVR